MYMEPAAYDGTTTSGTQPWKNITTMGKVDDDNKISYKHSILIT